MRRRRVILASLVAAAGFIACNNTGDRVMQRFDGPVKIENVQRYAAPNMCTCESPVPSGYPRLVVHDDRTFEIESTEWCHEATLKQHGPKKLIALYCPTKYGTDFEEWRIFRRLGEGKYIEDCPFKGAAAPDLDRVAPLAESAVPLVKCSYGTQRHAPSTGNKYVNARYRLIADALAKADGAQAVAKMLDQTIDIPPIWGSAEQSPVEDGWMLEVGRLEADVRAGFLERTCRALERGDSSDIAYVRAARLCPLDSEAVKAQASARMRRTIDTHLPGDDFERGTQAWLWATAIASRSQPKPKKPAGKDASIGAWGAEVDAPVPRPGAIAYPSSRKEFLCGLKREYDAGACPVDD